MIFILLKNLDIPMIYLDSQPGLNRKASNHERASDQSSTVLQQPAGNFGLAAAVCIDGKWSQFPLRSLPVVGPALGLGRAPAQIHPESMLTYCTNLHESAQICTTSQLQRCKMLQMAYQISPLRPWAACFSAPETFFPGLHPANQSNQRSAGNHWRLCTNFSMHPSDSKSAKKRLSASPPLRAASARPAIKMRSSFQCQCEPANGRQQQPATHSNSIFCVKSRTFQKHMCNTALNVQPQPIKIT